MSCFPSVFRELLRERATADFYRSKDYKGSAEHLDKTSSSTSSSPMYYPGMAPLTFEVPSMGHDNPVGDQGGGVHPSHTSLHPSQQPQPPHPTGTQTLQRRPHTPHMGHGHTPSHNGGGNPHSHAPHHPSPMPQNGVHPPMPQHHVDSDTEKKNAMKMENERKKGY